MARYCLGIFLGLQAVTDQRTGYVSMTLLILQSAAGLYLGCLRGVSGPELWGRFLPGAVLLAASRFSGEKIGQGDGWLFVSLGIYLSALQQITLLFLSVCLAALWIIPRLCFHFVEKDSEVAFIPFVLAAYLGGWYYGWI